jgi:hypothetical protein
MKLTGSLLLSIFCLIAVPTLAAQNAPDLNSRIEKLEKRVQALETENANLKEAIEQIRRPRFTPPSTNLRGAGENANPAGRALAQQCGDKMKVVGLAFRIFSVDHSDKLPFHLPAAEGGSKEFVSIGTDGFDQNSLRHFTAISNQLVTPSHLHCPGDNAKQPALTFNALQNSNVTYLLRSGPDVTEMNPRAVLLKCPIHNHQLLMDGTVAPTSPATSIPNQSQNDSRRAPVEPVAGQAACRANLRNIDGAKAQWALVNRIPRGVPADEGGVNATLGNLFRPVCPSGGRYTYGPVGANPACSVPGHAL